MRTFVSKNAVSRLAICACLLPVLPLAHAAKPITVDMTADHWQTKENAEFLRELGFFHGLMRLNSGNAVLKDVTFGNGTIEFDINTIGRGAPGAAEGGRGARGAAPAAAAPATPTVGAAPAPAPPQGGGGGGLVVQGLPLLKPPYGLLNAIDLDKGELKWQVPHGDTPDAVRNSPVLAGKTIPKTGQPGSVGLVVTKSLVVLGDPSITTTPDHPRGAMFRAYDKTNGKEVGAVWMPAPQSGSPMTYMANGRQYFIVAVSGGNYSGEYIAFALPQSEVRPTTAGGQR